jgi:hypothetical protein
MRNEDALPAAFQFNDFSSAINGTNKELKATPTNSANVGSRYILRGFQGGAKFYAKVTIMPTTPATATQVWRVVFGNQAAGGANFNEGIGWPPLPTDVLFAGVDIEYNASTWNLDGSLFPFVNNISFPPPLLLLQHPCYLGVYRQQHRR